MRQHLMDYDVTVIGAGPTGLMLACELAIGGVSALVIDRLAEPRTTPRALALRARSLEVLAQRGFDWFSDAPPLRLDSFGQLRLVPPADPRLVSRRVPQLEVEQRLESRALELGVTIRRGHEMVGMRQEEGTVTVEVSGPAGGYQIRSRYLVGCDGAGSTTRRLAGIPFPVTPATIHGINAQVRPDNDDVSQYAGARLNSRGTLMVVPMPDDEFRVSCAEFGQPEPDRRVPPTLDELRAKIRRVADLDLDLGVAVHISRYANATGLTASYQSGRVLIAGDAAHMQFSSGGQGMNTGLQDAMNLGWKLAAAVHGWAPDGLLETYHTERHPVGARVCWNTRAQVALYTPLDQIAPFRELFGELLQIEDVRRYLTEMLTGIAVRYPMPDAGPDSHQLLGTSIWDLTLCTPAGPMTTFQALHRARGVLLHMSGAAPAPVTERWRARVDTIVAEPVPGLDAASLLIRPDGHIVHADRAGTDHEGVRMALATWFGRPGEVSPGAAGSGPLPSRAG
jgi:bifunctional hydroxylase/dehydrase